MAEAPALRVSDDEREACVAILREHSAEGRLPLEELARRVEEAYRAQTADDLARALRELPQRAPARRRRPKRLTLALFGNFRRRGRWRIARRTTAISICADIDLDLREADLDGPTVSVNVFALFGNADVYVPEGVELDAGGLVLVGHRREWGRDGSRPGAPLIRVRALSLFGAIDVWRVPPGMRGSYREIVRALKEGRPELP
jgi:hypothetical protein